MDDPNITIEEYIRLEEEKARRRGKVYNLESDTAIVFDDAFTSEVTLSCEPTTALLSSVNLLADMEGRALTTLEELSQRVTYVVATLAQDTHEMAVHAELLAYRAKVRALHEQISVLQRQGTKDSDRLT
ncbi:hypothetical protein Tco_0664254 [Tanacetum coccineum]